MTDDSTNPASNNNNYVVENTQYNNNNSHHKHQQTALKLEIPDAQHTNGGSTPVAPIKTKKKRRDKSDLGDNFVAPDGGWGWLVAIAGGINILVSFAVAQQFGIIFRERMSNLGISSSQLTTIINVQIAVSSFTGLLNGPIFRRFTYRQVALFGSFTTFLGLFLSVFADSFVFYVCSYSCFYGSGRGLTVSASSLAVNTYFKQKRRTATAYEFGVAGLGPIFLPYLATFLLQFFGVQGTVLIFSGVSLHTFACSLIYQPVRWHIKKPDTDAESLHEPEQEQFIKVEEIEQIAEPDTPILPRANDGWYGSRHSLHTAHKRNRLSTGEKEREGTEHMTELKRLNSRDYTSGKSTRKISVTKSIKEEQEHEHSDEHVPVLDLDQSHIHDPEQNLNNSKQLPPQSATADAPELHELQHEERKKLPFYKKIAIFFDLDLLRDVTYLNLAIGLTLINFVEINFAILTPFILSDLGFANSQIAMAMSILGFCDLVIRFLIPVITAKMSFSNKTFFIFGIIGMCIGRTVLSCTRNFYVMLGAFIWMGLNKAFRTVFWSLIIPSYVPLKRLPAASGLQLLMSGLFSMAFGPLIGLIRDNTNFSFTLNFLNMLCMLAVLTWIGEALWRKHQRKSKPVNGDIN